MLKRKFRWEKAKVLYKYLIEENSLIKDSESAEEILNTLCDCPVSFLKEVNRKDGTKICLFYVADEENNIFIYFCIGITNTFKTNRRFNRR